MVSSRRIRIGIIGASANKFAWASTAHVPALKSLPEYELVAVASRNQGNADAAAVAHGIPRAYGDYLEMVRQPDLDMICVSTGSVDHHALIMRAIEAGKHVFCEWPFGTNIGQALEMRDFARAKGVRTLVGLQTRYAPIVRYVRDLIAAGFIGKLYAVTFSRSNDQMAQMDLTPEYRDFLESAKAGLRIMGGHGFDTLAAYVGELTDVQSYMETEMDRVRLTTGEVVPLTDKDHILVQGRLADNAVVSVLLKQNSPTYQPFFLEISGSSGAIIITASSDIDYRERHPGVPFDFEMFGTSALGKPAQPMTVPARYRLVPDETPPGPSIDAAHMFRHFAEALVTGSRCDTDFDHGVHRHELLETIVRAAEKGQRMVYAPT